MNFQSNLSRNLGLAAAATMAAGLVTAGPADAASPAAASASVANDILTVRGTNGDDAISVAFVAEDPDTVLVDLGDGTATQRFDRNTFDAVAVFLRGGDDEFRTVSGGTSVTDPRLTVHGGSDDDAILGGAGDDTLFGGAGADDIRGGGGTDLIIGNRGRDLVDGGIGNDTQILGTGADTALWVPGEGSDVVNGGAAHDTLVFDGSNLDEVMSLSADGDDAVLLRDIGTIRMDLDGVEQVDLTTLGGADSVTVDDLERTDVHDANIDLSALGAGDGQSDEVTVNGTNTRDKINVGAHDRAVDVRGLPADIAITGSELIDHLQVNGRGGNDRVAVSDDATALIGVRVDLGSGQR